MATLSRTCAFEDCAVPSRSRGFCDRHYRRWKAYGDPGYTPREDPVARAAMAASRPPAKGRKSDPCTGCGKPVQLVNTSAGPGKMTCMPCRRARRDVGKPTHCAFCSEAFEPRHSRRVWTQCCSKSCARLLEYEKGTHSFQAKPRYGVMSPEEAASRAAIRREVKTRDRRARLLGVEREYYTTDTIAERDSGVCHLCDKTVDMGLRWPDLGSASVDHILPLSKGGDDTLANVALACLGCNLSKGNRV